MYYRDIVVVIQLAWLCLNNPSRQLWCEQTGAVKFNKQICGRYKWTVTQWLILILKSGRAERYNAASLSLSLDLTSGPRFTISYIWE